jgi:hypothetical protein
MTCHTGSNLSGCVCHIVQKKLYSYSSNLPDFTEFAVKKEEEKGLVLFSAIQQLTLKLWIL